MAAPKPGLSALADKAAELEKANDKAIASLAAHVKSRTILSVVRF